MTELDDLVLACADLIDRAGAASFDIGYLDDQPPHRWYAHTQYRGARITVENHKSPTGAALALARRVLDGATCRCGQTVTLSDGEPGCMWRLVGARWEPGCDVPSIVVAAGGRGNLAAMKKAVSGNRAARRAAKKSGRKLP